MTTVLVTGANGFVGVNVVRRLAQRGARVIALARRPPDPETIRFLSDEADRIDWVEGDVRDRSGLTAIARAREVDHIVHGAAITPSPSVEREQTATVVDVNLGGTVNALEAARVVGARRFVLISSTGLYGAPDRPDRPISEDVPRRRSSLYTICKTASEDLCRQYSELHGLSTVAGRLGSAYGPMERASRSRERMSTIYELAHRALDGRSIRVYGADRYRDFCYVDDIAEAFAALVFADRLRWDIYNVGSDVPVTVRDVCTILSSECPDFVWRAVDTHDDADLAIMPAQERAPLELRRLRDDLDFRPQYSLERGLRAYLEWLRAGWQHL